jgi:hypothetical protein
MENTLLVGLSRQVTLERQMDVVANNVANINTTGFKADRSLFEEYLRSPAHEANFAPADRRVSFVHDRATFHDFAAGPSEQTKNPLDVAIDGKAFLVVQTAAGRGMFVCVATIAEGSGTRSKDNCREICVLHADTLLPDDAVAVMRRVLADPETTLAGFTPLLSGPDQVRWGTSFHNWIKTWYAPLLFRPQLFLRGVRLLFGDHAMFFRRADFLAVGGCDPTLLVMEEADLCIRFHRLGRTRLVNRVVITSDRRVAAWGALRANWIYLKVGACWGLGFRKGLERLYPDVR